MNTMISNNQSAQQRGLHRRLRLGAGSAIQTKVGRGVIGSYAVEVVQLRARAVHINGEVLHLSESHHAHCGMDVLDLALNNVQEGGDRSAVAATPVQRIASRIGVDCKSLVSSHTSLDCPQYLGAPCSRSNSPGYGSQEIVRHHLFNVQSSTPTHLQPG